MQQFTKERASKQCSHVSLVFPSPMHSMMCLILHAAAVTESKVDEKLMTVADPGFNVKSHTYSADSCILITREWTIFFPLLMVQCFSPRFF